MVKEILNHYLDEGFAPLATELYLKEHRNQKKFPAVFTSLLNKKALIRLDVQYCVHRDYYEKAKQLSGKWQRRSRKLLLENTGIIWDVPGRWR